MSKEQKGQPPHMSYPLPHTPTVRSRPSQCLDIEAAGLPDLHTAQYLDDLRGSKLSRPSGSRPPPPSKFTTLRRIETEANVTPQASAHDDRPTLLTSNSMPIMSASKPNHSRADSDMSSKSPFAGRPLARPPSATPTEEAVKQPAGRPIMQRTPSMQYMERGTRWMEKQEVRSLRMALEDMDHGEEKKVHNAAQDEAAHLVWKHQNPDAPFGNPDAPYANPDVHRDYRSHLRKGSYQRSHSQEVVSVVGQRKTSGGSQGQSIDMSISSKHKSMGVLRKVSPPSAIVSVKKSRTPSGKSYGGLSEAVAGDIAKAHRRISSGSKRILSGEKKLFMHPNDRIWEDLQEERAPASKPILDQQKPDFEPPKVAAPTQPAHIRKNPFARVRMQAERLERSKSEPIVSAPMMHHSVEIQRNPPSQSRKAWYMSNEPLPPTPPSPRDRPADEVLTKVTPTNEGKEVRGDDIRSATSKHRKDYSPKLPRPTMVSDKPGRPIVSFKQDWKPKEIVLEEVHAAPLPTIEADPLKTSNIVPEIYVDESPRPPIPTINLPDEPAVPCIVLPEEPDFAESSNVQSAPVTPSINTEAPEVTVQSPAINSSGPEEPSPRSNRAAQRHGPVPARPQFHHAATSPIPKSTPHYTPSVRQSGVLCAHCALPIAGRILSAAGERFHPSCFICNQCHTNLELVAFYPEPDRQSSERLNRIAARQTGILSDGMNVDDLFQLEAEDGDETLRFYCHLDFHELFSPRCKSCKTPIEGEVIVACGAEWHAGHFFCAQCGDPFDSSTPFVEKDGYAWCVGCHTNRYSSKCRKCRKPVTDMVVKALGHDWHGNCFACMVSILRTAR